MISQTLGAVAHVIYSADSKWPYIRISFILFVPAFSAVVEWLCFLFHGDG